MGNLCASVPKTADNGSVNVQSNIRTKNAKKELTSEMAGGSPPAPLPTTKKQEGLVLESSDGEKPVAENNVEAH